MKSNQIIETTGIIKKVETLTNVEEHILPNTLVLISDNPFPGYRERSNIENNTVLNSVYLVLMYRYFPEKIERISKYLGKKYENCYFDCGEIIVQNSIYPCIRILGIVCNEVISGIQTYYKNNDIKFMAYKKINNEANIRVFKHFKVTEVVNGIYRDLYEGEKFYIVIPNQINWKILRDVTFKIREKMANPEFDAALGIINRFTGPEDVIRILDSDKTLKRTLEIKNKYIKELKKRGMLIANLNKTVSSSFFQ
jgi:hypothetical protein